MARVGAGRAALGGLVSAGVALGVTELGAGVLPRVPSFVASMGSAVIDHAPGWFVRFGIDRFGTDDKPALVTGIVVLSLLIGAALGVLARRRLAYAAIGFGAFGVLGVAAAAGQPLASVPWTIVTGVLGVGAGLGTLTFLLRWPAAAPEDKPDVVAFERRRFLLTAGGFAVFAATTALVGRRLLDSAASAAQRLGLPLPRPASPAEPVPAGASLAVPGLGPVVTPNDDFYRVDVQLLVPRYSTHGWTLKVGGAVDAPYQLSYDEILAMPMVEEHVTLACVSNLVGGPLVGNARWLGVPLADIVGRARPHPGADQLVGRSIDGFTAGMPTAVALDGRIALVAVGMNGAPLPDEHGFPLRLVVAGLYGYVSATKWLTELQLTRFDALDPYWVELGWDAMAPVLVESRIDVPGDGRQVAAGRQVVAGVAWAPIAGISRVEVQVDDGPWAEATLADAISSSTWRQWAYPWDAGRGSHRIRVRATDGQGAVQTEAARDPFPNAATGYHTISVAVA